MNTIVGMGFDGVEIVLEVEEEFRITVADAEAEAVRSVGDLVTLVCGKLPLRTQVCPTVHAFYYCRRLICENTSLDRKRIRPKTALRDLFPPDLRRTWQGIEPKEFSFPHLVVPNPKKHALQSIIGALIIAWIVSLFFVLPYGPGYVVVPIWLVGGFFVVAILAGAAEERFRTEIPAELETVGDLARQMAPFVAFDDSDEDHYQIVFTRVQRILSEQLGIPTDRIRPEYDLIRDLHMD